MPDRCSQMLDWKRDFGISRPCCPVAKDNGLPWRAPSQVIELRKEVLDVRFVGYGGEAGGADDATPPSALMTTTADGCLRLFAAGARRPAANNWRRRRAARTRAL